jgi:hypothetical protein
MLAAAEVDALDDGGVALPAAGRPHLLDRRQRAAHDPVSHADQTAPPDRRDHLCVEEVRQWPPARLGRRAFRLVAGRLDPLPIRRAPSREILPKAIGAKQGGAGGRQDLRDMVDKARRQRQGARADVDGPQELGHGIQGHPDPGRGTGQAFDGLGRREVSVLDRTEHRLQLITVQLLAVQITQRRGGEGPQMIPCFDPPVQHGVGGDGEPPRGGANAEPLCQAGQHVDDQLHGALLAMQERAVVLREIPRARGAVEWAPGATTGMAMGAELPPPQPAALATAPMGAKVLRGVHGARPALRRGPRLGWGWRRHGGRGGLRLTQGALRPLSQAGKRCGCLGARASRWRGWHNRLATGSGMLGPQRAEHEEDTHQSYKPKVGEKESRYHGNAPTEDREMRALSRVWGLSELSAVILYTTSGRVNQQAGEKRHGETA